MVPHTIIQEMGQYDDVEYPLAVWIVRSADKHRCDHHVAVNEIAIRLKTRRHAIPRLLLNTLLKTLLSAIECQG